MRIRIIHIIMKVANPMKSARVYTLFCECLNVHDKVLMFYPEVISYQKEGSLAEE